MSPTARTGELSDVNVYARDSSDVATPGYRGRVHFTSTDPAAVIPDHTFTSADSGTFIATITFKTPGKHTVTVTDIATSSITGVSPTVTVTSPVATKLGVGTVPFVTTVGYPVAVIVTARGSGGGTDLNYQGTVAFTSKTDPGAVVPAPYKFTAADRGTHIFCLAPPDPSPNPPCTPQTPGGLVPDGESFLGGATFSAAGDAQTVTATDTADPTIAGTSDPITVTSGTVAIFKVSANQTDAFAGQLATVTVTALDDAGKVTRAYRGTVHFTSSDPAAGLPPDYAFSSGDAGSHLNFPLKFNTLGPQTVTVTDRANGATGTSAPTTVSPDPNATTTTSSAPSTTTTTTLAGTTTTTIAGTTTTTTSATGTTTTTTGAKGTSPTASGPATVHRGDQITLTGSGFASTTPLSVTMFSAPTELGTTTSDPAGAFRATVSIPADAALGSHTISISTADGMQKAVVAFMVTARPLASSAGPLAFTGLSTLGPIHFGGRLLAIGLVALCLSRRPKSRRDGSRI